MFETFNVPAMYVAIQAVLSLYASGRTTGKFGLLFLFTFLKKLYVYEYIHHLPFSLALSTDTQYNDFYPTKLYEKILLIDFI